MEVYSDCRNLSAAGTCPGRASGSRRRGAGGGVGRQGGPPHLSGPAGRLGHTRRARPRRGVRRALRARSTRRRPGPAVGSTGARGPPRVSNLSEALRSLLPSPTLLTPTFSLFGRRTLNSLLLPPLPRLKAKDLPPTYLFQPRPFWPPSARGPGAALTALAATGHSPGRPSGPRTTLDPSAGSRPCRGAGGGATVSRRPSSSPTHAAQEARKGARGPRAPLASGRRGFRAARVQGRRVPRRGGVREGAAETPEGAAVESLRRGGCAFLAPAQTRAPCESPRRRTHRLRVAPSPTRPRNYPALPRPYVAVSVTTIHYAHGLWGPPHPPRCLVLGTQASRRAGRVGGHLSGHATLSPYVRHQERDQSRPRGAAIDSVFIYMNLVGRVASHFWVFGEL